ncbi:ABC transporter substrate-binding protein [Sinomonas terrae]|uniref:ABC transporter substrate-binding protein n=1 Tax=Sinomonas terrae TaxID=2908838 RepID=A0ABS9U543_9MICC|nr:ABC transporter substrate-binding protein [Sinomonas terrae]MCH6471802.1 ABC transporter substrate-binding protein [Sinomonas terrae]HKU10891.1 ABC transporter substrate-binding protein [Sinomonas sp.]
MKKTKLLAPVLTVALSGAFMVSAAAASNAAEPVSAAAPSVSSPAQAAPATIAPVTINQLLSDGSTLAGTFTPTQFLAQNGQLVVQGVFNGTLTSATGAVTQITNSPVTSTVTNATTSGACNVLSLTLGPLHLDLLGLVVDLNQVNLNITAQPGPGNLLGNLLCSVAGLLDNGHGLQGLTQVLNNLLAGL